MSGTAIWRSGDGHSHPRLPTTKKGDTSMSFSDDAIAYLRSQPLTRLATWAPDDQPDVVSDEVGVDGAATAAAEQTSHADTGSATHWGPSRLALAGAQSPSAH